MKLVLLLCFVAVAASLAYDYDDYDNDRPSKSLKKSRKRDADDYDDYYDEYDNEKESLKSKKRKAKSDDLYDDYYDDYDYEEERKGRLRSKKRRDRYEEEEDYEDADYYDYDEQKPKKRKSKKTRRKSEVRNFRKYGRSGHFEDDYDNNDVDRYDYDNDYDTIKDDYDYDAPNGYGGMRRRGYQGHQGFGNGRRFGRMGPGPMANAARAAQKQKPITKFVPVVVKKKSKKKSKIITVTKGFYIPGGTQLFGKFNDLHSCEKSCEITSTCFAGDYNPWLKKCYGHGNITACTTMKSNDQITHFSKVPCTVTDTPRGLVTLGVRAGRGIEMKGINSLQKCIKKCVNMGGGIAPANSAASVMLHNQICFAIDYDFASHKCYVHAEFKMCIDTATAVPSENQVKAASNVNVLLCPLAMAK